MCTAGGKEGQEEGRQDVPTTFRGKREKDAKEEIQYIVEIIKNGNNEQRIKKEKHKMVYGVCKMPCH